MQSKSKIVWRYGVQGYGVKNRCRKENFFSTDKGELGNDTTLPDNGVAVTLAKAWLRENMKTSRKATATITLWTIQPDGGELWEVFTDAHNIKIPLNLQPNQTGE